VTTELHRGKNGLTTKPRSYQGMISDRACLLVLEKRHETPTPEVRFFRTAGRALFDLGSFAGACDLPGSRTRPADRPDGSCGRTGIVALPPALDGRQARRAWRATPHVLTTDGSSVQLVLDRRADLSEPLHAQARQELVTASTRGFADRLFSYVGDRTYDGEPQSKRTHSARADKLHPDLPDNVRDGTVWPGGKSSCGGCSARTERLSRT